MQKYISPKFESFCLYHGVPLCVSITPWGQIDQAGNDINESGSDIFEF